MVVPAVVIAVIAAEVDLVAAAIVVEIYGLNSALWIFVTLFITFALWPHNKQHYDITATSSPFN